MNTAIAAIVAAIGFVCFILYLLLEATSVQMLAAVIASSVAYAVAAGALSLRSHNSKIFDLLRFRPHCADQPRGHLVSVREQSSVEETIEHRDSPKFRQINIQHNEEISLPRVFCAGSCVDTRSDAVSLLVSEIGLSVDMCDDLDESLGMLASERPGHRKCLIIEVEDLRGKPDLDEIVEDLLVFRQAVPHVPLLLVSSSFLRDDFEAHRLPVADASLSRPVSRRRLEIGVMAACQNNKIWLIRCMNDTVHA